MTDDEERPAPDRSRTSTIDVNGPTRLIEAFSMRYPQPGQRERFDMLRKQARAFAELIVDEVPDGRERSCALTALEDSLLWAKNGIERSESIR